jgi:cation transport ATPase
MLRSHPAGIFKVSTDYVGIELVVIGAVLELGSLVGSAIAPSKRSEAASEQELVAMAAAAETSSEHPLAQAVLKAAFDRGVTPPDVESFEAIPGKGIVARIGGHEISVGNPRFLTERGINLINLRQRIEPLEAAGRTVIGVARDGGALGIIALGDTIRSDAHRAVASLRKAGLKPALVTGDNERAAMWVARDLGGPCRRIAAGQGRHRAKTSDRRSGRHGWRRYQ